MSMYILNILLVLSCRVVLVTYCVNQQMDLDRTLIREPHEIPLDLDYNSTL